jgi:hypothetical protein
MAVNNIILKQNGGKGLNKGTNETPPDVVDKKISGATATHKKLK